MYTIYTSGETISSSYGIVQGGVLRVYANY